MIRTLTAAAFMVGVLIVPGLIAAAVAALALWLGGLPVTGLPLVVAFAGTAFIAVCGILMAASEDCTRERKR